jgi:ankyrin repeat protein
MKQLLITIAAVVLVGCVSNMSIYETAKKGNIKAVKEHLAAGTDVNAKDSEGKTPLDHALNKPSEIVDFLIKQGGKTGEELKAEAK